MAVTLGEDAWAYLRNAMPRPAAQPVLPYGSGAWAQATNAPGATVMMRNPWGVATPTVMPDAPAQIFAAQAANATRGLTGSTAPAIRRTSSGGYAVGGNAGIPATPPGGFMQPVGGGGGGYATGGGGGYAGAGGGGGGGFLPEGAAGYGASAGGGYAGTNRLSALLEEAAGQRGQQAREARGFRSQAFGDLNRLVNEPAVSDAASRAMRARVLRYGGARMADLDRQNRESLGRAGLLTGGRGVEAQRRSRSELGQGVASGLAEADLQAILANAAARRAGLSGRAAYAGGMPTVGEDLSPEIAVEAERLSTAAQREQTARDLAAILRSLGEEGAAPAASRPGMGLSLMLGGDAGEDWGYGDYEPARRNENLAELYRLVRQTGLS